MSTSGTTRPLRGSMTALVTPFRQGAVDFGQLEELVRRQIESGTDWLVPCGTTGEAPTLTADERHSIVDLVIATSNGQCGVMVGTGTYATRETIQRTKDAAAAGANAALVVAPYYNRPTPEGLYRHFAAVADTVDLPIVLYNVPARTGVSIPNDVVVRLRNTYPHIAAIKHATGSIDGVTELLGRCDIAVLSGDDALTWPLMCMGAVGVISVIGNLSPGLLRSLVDAGLRGDADAGRSCHGKLHDLAEGLGRFGPNPLPIKTAMASVNLLVEEFRLPLCPLSDEARSGIEAVLRAHEIHAHDS